MTECSKPRRGMIMVASHLNGWVKKVNGKRAFRYATISDGVSRTYGTPAYDKYAIPAIEMAGYPYQMPTASSRGDSTTSTQIVPARPLVACRSATKGDACQSKKARSYFFIITKV